MRSFLFFVGLFFLFSSAAAQTTAPVPLVVVSCYAKWLVTTRPEVPVEGKDFVFVKRESIPTAIRGPIEGVQSEFTKSMEGKGFEVSDLRNCPELAGDDAIVVTVYGLHPTPKAGIYRLIVELYVRKPGEGRAMPVDFPAVKDGDRGAVVTAITNAAVGVLGKTQPKPSADPPANS